AGVALGLALFVLQTTGRTLDYFTQEMLGLALMVVAISMAQCLTVRRHPFGPRATFPARYFAAMFTAATAALVGGIIAWLHYAVLDPGYLEHFYQQYLDRAQAAAATPEDVTQMREAAERMKHFITDPLSRAMVQFGTLLM